MALKLISYIGTDLSQTQYYINIETRPIINEQSYIWTSGLIEQILNASGKCLISYLKVF
jgi:hypothetical protein